MIKNPGNIQTEPRFDDFKFFTRKSDFIVKISIKININIKWSLKWRITIKFTILNFYNIKRSQI